MCQKSHNDLINARFFSMFYTKLGTFNVISTTFGNCMKKSLIVLLSLLCSLSLFETGCKSGFFGKFTGQVVDPELRRPIAGVKIILDDKKYHILTDAKGMFSFDGVNAGNHTVTVKYGSPYFEDAVVPVVVRHDKPVHVLVVPDIKSDAVYESPKDTLKLSSLKPSYKLFRGGFGFGTSREYMTNHLVLIQNKKRKLIMRPNQMKGYVQLKDSVQVLEYARFFTDYNTYYLFKDPDPDNSFIEVKSATGKPSYGEMEQERFKRLGLKNPILTYDENHFYITRYLVSKTQKLFKVKETIDFDGNYEMTKSLIITHIDIPFPPIPKSAR